MKLTTVTFKHAITCKARSGVEGFCLIAKCHQFGTFNEDIVALKIALMYFGDRWVMGNEDQPLTFVPWDNIASWTVYDEADLPEIFAQSEEAEEKKEEPASVILP